MGFPLEWGAPHRKRSVLLPHAGDEHSVQFVYLDLNSPRFFLYLRHSIPTPTWSFVQNQRVLDLRTLCHSQLVSC